MIVVFGEHGALLLLLHAVFAAAVAAVAAERRSLRSEEHVAQQSRQALLRRPAFTWPWLPAPLPPFSFVPSVPSVPSAPPSAPPPSYVTPYVYPLLKQCDARWANQTMEHDTICQVGCFMSSVSMALNGRGVKIPVVAQNNSTTAYVTSNPSTFNTWLKNHSGYVPVDILNAGVIPTLTPRFSLGPEYMHRTNDLTYQEVAAYMQQGKVIVANVLKGTHFVLLTGYAARALLPANTGLNMSTSSFRVNDPGFNTPSYAHNTIVGWRIFSVSFSVSV